MKKISQFLELMNDKRFYIFLSLIFTIAIIASCSQVKDDEKLFDFDQVILESLDYFEQDLHGLSEEIYDGHAKGTWGESVFNYKMALRDVYWKVDAYHQLINSGHNNFPEYLERRDEGLSYLMSAQVIDDNVGVWGIPQDFINPEFGDLLEDIYEQFPDFFVNNFLVTLHDEEISQLYYDHGRVLTTFCKVYIDTQNEELLPYIERGANWILDKPGVKNVNYNSSVIEGLSYAYIVLHSEEYLEKAITLTQDSVFSQANENGSFGDKHNQEPWYHGFIVSGLVGLKMALPEEHAMHDELDPYLENALAYLVDVTKPGSKYSFQSAGINSRVWSEVEDLAQIGKWPKLSEEQKEAYANCLYQVIHGDVQPTNEEGFRMQKILYHYIQIGNAIANH